MREKPNPEADLLSANLSKQQQDIVDILARAYPRRIHVDALIGTLYENDPSGGPDYATQVLRTQIFRIRQKIAPLGWTIPSNRSGCEAKSYCYYSLQPIANDNEVTRVVPFNGGCSTLSGTASVVLPRVSIIDGLAA